MYVKGFTGLFSFPGYVVKEVTVGPDAAQVRLQRDKRCTLRCPHCGRAMSRSRSVMQYAWDLPLGSARTVMLRYEAVQGRCRACDVYVTIRPPGIDERARATERLKRFVSGLCRRMPLDHVREVVLPASPSTACRWDKRVLQETLPEPDLSDLRILLIDEKSVRKRHGYVTLVMNGETGELLHMAEGRKKASLQAFFDRLTDERKKRIRAVCMDRAGAYFEAVNANLPHVDIVFDKFHVIRNYHGVIDQVRRRAWREACKEDKAVIKGQRYNLFRNPDRQSPEQRRSLRALLAVNTEINTVYVLKDALKQMWTYANKASAGKYFEHWLAWAREPGIEPLSKFADSLARAKEQILNYCTHPITTGRLEGFNNLVARILHRSCGIKDIEYLFLRLRRESLASRVDSCLQM